jgi:hypothetical protein
MGLEYSVCAGPASFPLCLPFDSVVGNCVLTNSGHIYIYIYSVHSPHCRYIRIGETVRANSLGAKLVFCTLPVPAENTPAAMYGGHSNFFAMVQHPQYCCFLFSLMLTDYFNKKKHCPGDIIPKNRYLSWIDTMSYNAPPMILVRGNQQSVLTFLS